MGSFSIWHWLVVLLVVLLLFGSGKISGLMGDLAKGIKSFKQNIKEDDTADASMTAENAPPASGTITGPAATTTASPAPGATTTTTAGTTAGTTGRPAA
ncbi:twin-arginine translocase TatA/TatE family subunit [Sabulicella glaciei]|uniref:Sec-independent protein translocase protein TatA n=1 Tax=Sabulicella glaciei TaxID=2984948 RepID=A0ABT3NUG0_9PROT|nr:twin-arginine translocase TatA/TatE family subunit [Roseococcus sp. MDT2-1-1]MCW8085789.1 twin-arginine translocase TatA/TatE family subunit [Roseococcus sp. MDT2-1-1]